jgi:hypothetical protein
MKAKRIFEDINDILKPKSSAEIFNLIKDLPKEEKIKEAWKFLKKYPSAFHDVEDNFGGDDETNKLMVLFKIKAAMLSGEKEKINNFIKEMGERFGQTDLISFAKNLYVSGYRGDELLFNEKELQQLQISLYKETRNEEEQLRDELYNIYAFVGSYKFKEIEINKKIHNEKYLYIENLVKIDKYNTSSLNSISMMKIRAVSQGEDYKVYGVYIPKDNWDKDYAYNDEIPDNLRKFIDENKFKF